MPIWDSADLLRRCQNLARRPVTDQAMGAAKWYDFLTEAQTEAYEDVYTRFPDFMYSAPLQLVTADGGLTYTFGVDADGDPVRPFGHVELYPTARSVPNSPLTPGSDFIFEGGRIRFPGARPRNFPGGPWARFVADPDVAIDATHQPLMQPKSARILLVYKALEKWASRPGSGSKPEYYAQYYEKLRGKLWERLGTAYNLQGSASAGTNSVWWYSQDMGAIGLNT